MDIALEPFHWLGGPIGYTVLMPVVFWSTDDRLGRHLCLLAMSNVLVNSALKVWFGFPWALSFSPARIGGFQSSFIRSSLLDNGIHGLLADNRAFRTVQMGLSSFFSRKSP